MYDREHFVVKACRVLIPFSMGFGMINSACSTNGTRNPEDNRPKTTLPTPEPSLTPSSSLTPSPTASPTEAPTPTLTPSPTPDFEATNVYLMETVGKGEVITPTNFIVDNVLRIEPLVGQSFVFGQRADEEGKTTQVIENFDCQMDALVAAGELGEKLEVPFGPIQVLAGVDKWNPEATFDEMELTKTAELGPDVEFFTTERFVYQGEEFNCKEYSTRDRVSDKTRELIGKIIDFVDNLRNNSGLNKEGILISS